MGNYLYSTTTKLNNIKVSNDETILEKKETILEKNEVDIVFPRIPSFKFVPKKMCLLEDNIDTIVKDSLKHVVNNIHINNLKSDSESDSESDSDLNLDSLESYQEEIGYPIEYNNYSIGYPIE